MKISLFSNQIIVQSKREIQIAFEIIVVDVDNFTDKKRGKLLNRFAKTIRIQRINTK